MKSTQITIIIAFFCLQLNVLNAQNIESDNLKTEIHFNAGFVMLPYSFQIPEVGINSIASNKIAIGYSLAADLIMYSKNVGIAVTNYYKWNEAKAQSYNKDIHLDSINSEGRFFSTGVLIGPYFYKMINEKFSIASKLQAGTCIVWYPNIDFLFGADGMYDIIEVNSTMAVGYAIGGEIVPQFQIGKRTSLTLNLKLIMEFAQPELGGYADGENFDQDVFWSTPFFGINLGILHQF